MITLALLVLAAVPPARTQDATLEVVKDATSRLKACAANTRGERAGNFRLQWDITAEGVPENVEALGVRDAQTNACLVREVSALRWARASARSHVEVPFKVRSRGDGHLLTEAAPAARGLYPVDKRGVLAVMKRTMPLLVAACGKSDETVWATWAITEAGTVADVVIEGPPGSRASTSLRTCIEGELGQLRWLPSARGVPRVRFPLRMR